MISVVTFALSATIYEIFTIEYVNILTLTTETVQDRNDTKYSNAMHVRDFYFMAIAMFAKFVAIYKISTNQITFKKFDLEHACQSQEGKKTELAQACSQEFRREGPRFWITASKGGLGCHPHIFFF